VELSLQTCFDLGVSFGLTDGVFEPHDEATVRDISGIGISNPLGLGRKRPLSEPTVSLWREEATHQVERLNRENVLNAPTNDVMLVVRSHPIKSCEVTVHAVGVAFLRLDFETGVVLPIASDFLHCFEYAAYTVRVSQEILKDSRTFAVACLKKRRWWEWRPFARRDPLAGLSKRPEPSVKIDEKKYQELSLFSGLTHIALCLDKADNVEEIKKAIVTTKKPGSEEPDCSPFSFEYHGKIWFNWAECVIEPRSFDDPEENPEAQIRRMLTCIEIAHTFQGAVEAFKNLILHEIQVDAEAFIKGERVPGGLDYVDVNRLRALAAATVGLTIFENVTQADEDRAYFGAYEAKADLKALRDMVLKYSDVLAIVQKGESEIEQERRDDWLNTAVIFLTGFTVLTVLKDIFEFLKGEDKGFLENWIHDDIAIVTVLILIVGLAYLRRKVVHRKRRGVRR
jgi:hypothetical protein